MELRKLQIFLAVARTGSFTKAAELVNLSQSAVSQQMALLEGDVRAPLFERSRRGMKLTPFAIELCEKAEPLVIEMEHLGAAFGRRSGGQRTLRVGAFSTAGMELLPKAIRILKASKPDVQVSLSNVNMGSPEISLNTHEVDVILSYDYGLEPKISHPNVRKLDLFEDPFLAILPSKHPLVPNSAIQLRQLAAENWIFHRHASSSRNIYPLICSRAGFNPNVTFYVDDFNTLQGLIAEEIGVSMAPRLSLISKREGVSTLSLDPPVIRKISILTREDAGDKDDISKFVSALKEASKSLSLKQ